MRTKIKLTKEQQQNLLKIKKNHKSDLIRDRAQAVLIRNEGFTLVETAKALRRSQSFVKNAITQFIEGKLEITQYTSHHFKLSLTDQEAIIIMLQNQTPKDFGYKTQFWTMAIFKELIEKQYEVVYKDERSYRELFKKAGFSFHKPKPVDFRQDPEKIEAFKGALKKTYKSTRIRFFW
jgi:transposase